MDKVDDISPTLAAKSDQLNAADLIGGGITVKIHSVSVDKFSDQPVEIGIGNQYQPFRPCKTMRRLLANIWGTHSQDWIGNSLTLYCDPDVLWAGKKAGGIRISHATGITSAIEVPLRSSKHKVEVYKIMPLIIERKNYPDESLDSNIEEWKKLFHAGKTTPKILIEKINNEYILSTTQIEKINNSYNSENISSE